MFANLRRPEQNSYLFRVIEPGGGRGFSSTLRLQAPSQVEQAIPQRTSTETSVRRVVASSRKRNADSKGPHRFNDAFV